MRILWINGSGGNYKSQAIKGTGGWVGAMQDALLMAQPNIELGIVFFNQTDYTNVVEGNVTYIPVKYSYGKCNIEKLYLRHFRNENKYRKIRILEMVQRIHEYKPDLIHIWGLEHYYAGVLEFIDDIPIVVHIQGLSCSYTYTYTYTPPCFSRNDIKYSDSWFNRIVLKRGNFASFKEFENRAANELRLVQYVKNWIGRTDWDHTMSKILSPGSNYYHCDELMRSDFDGECWQYHYDGKTINIHSSISCDWYKGIDIVLKTADILKKKGISVNWNIYGWNRQSTLLKIFIKKTGIQPEDVGVIFRGRVDGLTIKNGLISCDCFVHPSYIENSSNAIAEAQILGVPVVAQYVGGNPSMLRDNSGILVAPNEPYIMASAILKMMDKDSAVASSENALAVAKYRHDKTNVVCTLINVYKNITNQKF